MNSAIFKDYTMPSGDPKEWDVVEEALGHTLAREFAREYLVDWDLMMSMHRLGYYGEDAAKKGKTLLKHMLVSQYLNEFIQDFGKQIGITPDNIIALLWAEANDRSFGSSSRSRITALKELRSIMMPEAKGKSMTRTEDGEEDGDEDYGMPRLNVVIHRVAPPSTEEHPLL